MKDFQDIEKRLRNGKLPDSDMSKHRYKVWQTLLQAQRTRRKIISFLSIPPWIWAVGSIIILILFFIFMFLLKK
jgi:hypothetical protein